MHRELFDQPLFRGLVCNSGANRVACSSLHSQMPASPRSFGRRLQVRCREKEYNGGLSPCEAVETLFVDFAHTRVRVEVHLVHRRVSGRHFFRFYQHAHSDIRINGPQCTTTKH